MPVSRGRKPKKTSRPGPAGRATRLTKAPWTAWRAVAALQDPVVLAVLEHTPFRMVNPEGIRTRPSLAELACGLPVAEVVESLEKLAEVGAIAWDEKRQTLVMTTMDASEPHTLVPRGLPMMTQSPDETWVLTTVMMHAQRTGPASADQICGTDPDTREPSAIALAALVDRGLVAARPAAGSDGGQHLVYLPTAAAYPGCPVEQIPGAVAA